MDHSGDSMPDSGNEEGCSFLAIADPIFPGRWAPAKVLHAQGVDLGSEIIAIEMLLARSPEEAVEIAQFKINW